MAFIYPEASHTFNEYLLVPGYSSSECIPENVSLRTPLVRFRKGEEEPAMSLNVPMVSAVMQAVLPLRFSDHRGRGRHGGQGQEL